MMIRAVAPMKAPTHVAITVLIAIDFVAAAATGAVGVEDCVGVGVGVRVMRPVLVLVISRGGADMLPGLAEVSKERSVAEAAMDVSTVVTAVAMPLTLVGALMGSCRFARCFGRPWETIGGGRGEMNEWLECKERGSPECC